MERWRIIIEWQDMGWYKSVENVEESETRLVKCADYALSRRQAQEAAGPNVTVNFFVEPHEYMEVVEVEHE